ncbi:copper chaperone for superoxide dismutase-like isoform X2 [Liolophura sinensis]|uniref:copper chaperone for superoxide dismutase-like isoform X2 n=1 Tax=Liolophura sinensis TaxID=3198878 RepID=UPI00315881B5
MAAPTKVEITVQMSCQGCVTAVEKVLKNTKGVKSFNVNLEKEQVLIESNLPSSRLLEIIESTGKKAVLVGYGSSTGTENLGAAVAMIESGSKLIRGVIRFVQSDENRCVIEGTIDGLSPGHHAVCVHDMGDLTNGCLSCGSVFSGIAGQRQSTEARPILLQKFYQLIQRVSPAPAKPYGLIGDIEARENGRAVFRVEKSDFHVWDVIGRSTVVHEGSLKYVKENDQEDKKRLACGIIARSAGLFENSKKICACDGLTVWDERDVPAAGGSRQSKRS